MQITGKTMSRYEKKKKKPNFIFTFEEGEPSKDECIADMAKVIFLLHEMEQRRIKHA